MSFLKTKFLNLFENSNSSHIFYFGYGSNVNNVVMRERCPGAIPIAIGAIPNRKFFINEHGVATLLPNFKSISYGILWVINSKHEVNLDIVEGIKRSFYYKETIDVYLGNKVCKSLIYFAVNQKIGTAKNGYIDTILQGINFFHGHKKWFDEIKKFK